MPSCEEYRALISCLVDEELSDEQAQSLFAHMETCESCKRVYDSFRFIASALSDDLDEPPENLAASVMEKIRETPRIEKKKYSPKVLFLRYGAMAACLALALLGASGLNLLPKGNTAAQSAAAPESSTMYTMQKGTDTAPAATQAPNAAPAPADMPPLTAVPEQGRDVVTTAGVGSNDNAALDYRGPEEKSDHVIMGIAPDNSAPAETLSPSRADAFLIELKMKNSVAETGLPDTEPEIVLMGESTEGDQFIVYVYNLQAKPLTIVNLNGANVLFTGDIEPYLTPES